LDLARIAPLPTDQKRVELRRLKGGRPPFSYDPMRHRILDILNADAGPLAHLPRTPWKTISAAIRAKSRSPKEATANLEVSEGLYDYATDHGLVGRYTEFFPLAVSMGKKVTYWSPVVVEIDGQTVVPFFDPRRDSKKLTVVARQFVFSVMHERIRLADEDFAHVRLAIMQFKNTPTGKREVIPHFDEGVPLWGFEALDEMIRETYALWTEILTERETEERGRGSGTTGPLGL
jgi:hypothetical protein